MIMTNILIIHGAFGNPRENWIPWLMNELEGRGCSVFAPEFPTPKNQTLDNGMRVFKEYDKYLDQNSIVVGHSLGVAFLLNVLEKRDKPIKSSFFVSGFTGALNNPEFDGINETIAGRTFDWQSIRKNCGTFHVMHSDNDPYVPLKKAEDLAENLGAELVIVPNAGHFNADAGYTKFELILEKILNSGCC